MSNFEFRYKSTRIEMIDKLTAGAGVAPNQVRIRDIDFFHNSGQPLWTNKKISLQFRITLTPMRSQGHGKRKLFNVQLN